MSDEGSFEIKSSIPLSINSDSSFGIVFLKAKNELINKIHNDEKTFQISHSHVS